MGQFNFNLLLIYPIFYQSIYIIYQIPLSTMTAPFIPPPIDSSAPTVGTLSAVSLPGLEETGPVAHTAPIVPGQPRPVVPAEEIGVPPAKALDPVAGGPGLFEKAKEIGMPVSRVSSLRILVE